MDLLAESIAGAKSLQTQVDQKTFCSTDIELCSGRSRPLDKGGGGSHSDPKLRGGGGA